MAKILDTKLPVAMGNCIHVMNLDKVDDEPDVFVCIQVEDLTGTKEYPILLTQPEYDQLKRIIPADFEKLVPGRCYNRFYENVNYFQVKIKDASGATCCGLFEIGFFGKCYERALRHPHSCTKKRPLRDLFD